MKKSALDESLLTSRLLGAVLAFELAKDMITSGMWMLQPGSMIGQAGHLSSMPTVFASLWMLLALLVVPYLVLQVTGCGEASRTRTTRLSCWAVLCSGVFWGFLGYLSKNIDHQYITGIFILNSMTCLAMSTILAGGLNAGQRRSQTAKTTT